MRIVSLVPSATETIVAWGLVPIAVTRFCERGDEFPTVGGTKDPRIDDIVAMRPDVVLMCDQENRLPDAEALIRAGVSVHRIHITHIDHVLPEMESLAAVLDLPASVAKHCAPNPEFFEERFKQRKRAYIPIWKRPWMTLNQATYATSLLALIGFDTISQGELTYPEMDLEQAASCKPDLVIAPNEPYVFGERHRVELETVAPTVFVDGKDLFWWGTRTPDGIDRLVRQLHVES
jgi:ABC-type Fe3+-hydroxamate transport system substrate-binding protein